MVKSIDTILTKQRLNVRCAVKIITFFALFSVFFLSMRLLFSLVCVIDKLYDDRIENSFQKE